MLPHHLSGLVARSALTPQELTGIQQLSEICEQYEQLHMRISWGMLESRSGNVPLDFLYYTDNQLVGYLGIDPAGEREVIGMVHPAYRRKGIFTALLKAAWTASTQQGSEGLLLICEHQSRSGQAFIAASGAIHRLSEHEMVLNHFQPRGLVDDRLCFRQAELSDFDALVTIQCASFGENEERARARLRAHVYDPTRRYYIATFGEESVGCEEPVGALRIDEWDNIVGIYAFGVIPDYQGRGYGRQMLEEAIRVIGPESGKTIMLDVDIENIQATSLYRSCGFQIKTTYDYYAYTLKEQ